MSNNKVGYIKFRDWHKTHSVHGKYSSRIHCTQWATSGVRPFFASSTMLDENLEIINDDLERIVAIAIAACRPFANLPGILPSNISPPLINCPWTIQFCVSRPTLLALIRLTMDKYILLDSQTRFRPMVENFPRSPYSINYRPFDNFFPSLRTSNFFLSKELEISFPVASVSIIFNSIIHSREHTSKKKATYRILPSRRSIESNRKAHIWMSDATRSSVGQRGQMDGFCCLETQGQSFKNGAEKFSHRWWWW